MYQGLASVSKLTIASRRSRAFSGKVAFFPTSEAAICQQQVAKFKSTHQSIPLYTRYTTTYLSSPLTTLSHVHGTVFLPASQH